ncbi:MAG TPA: SMP-30/gluconolactonase/LRE family protein [Chloroflexota bacterium]|nr:SMP-30/gluconolactonase/LRE family protein [Chloroflexota bacterium]
MDPMIEMLDSRLAELIADDARIESIAGGFIFTEGPVWRGDHLVFSDIPNGRLIRWDEEPGGPVVSTFRYPSGNANGNTLDRDGNLITCEHRGRRVALTAADGTVRTLVDNYQGKKLNSPNDVVVRSDGKIFFTDPPYGLIPTPNNPIEKLLESETGLMAVYRLDPDGTLTLLADDYDRPNGLAFSPDEKTLYVDDTARRVIRAYDVDAEGNISNDRVFFSFQGDTDFHGPDGLKSDVNGNIWTTGPGSVWVISPQGDVLGRIRPPEHPANLGFGGADWKTIFFTAQTGVYRMPVKVAGVAVGA